MCLVCAQPGRPFFDCPTNPYITKDNQIKPKRVVNNIIFEEEQNNMNQKKDNDNNYNDEVINKDRFSA
jgi:hypothetical protein